MLALDRGGCCEGVVYRLPDNDHHDQLRPPGAARDCGYREDVPATRWINVRTRRPATVRALVFYAGPRGTDSAGKQDAGRGRRDPRLRLPAMWAPAPMYLYQTVMKLEEHGIHDRRMWQLQEWVALNIAAMAQADTPEPPVNGTSRSLRWRLWSYRSVSLGAASIFRRRPNASLSLGVDGPGGFSCRSITRPPAPSPRRSASWARSGRCC